MKSENKKVLVVDDESSIRWLIVAMLDVWYASWEKATAENGREALEIINAGFVPDLMICDVIMLEMGGIKLFQNLRECGFDGGWLFMTGGCSEEEGKFLSENNLHVLLKPFNIGDFKVKLEEILAEE